jgi:hypothetical protein
MACRSTAFILSAKSRTTRSNFVDTFLEFREMRTSPVNLPATRATPELFVVDFCKRFESLNYCGLGSLSQRRIASKAPRKWGEGAEKVKPLNYFDSLVISLL